MFFLQIRDIYICSGKVRDVCLSLLFHYTHFALVDFDTKMATKKICTSNLYGWFPQSTTSCLCLIGRLRSVISLLHFHAFVPGINHPRGLTWTQYRYSLSLSASRRRRSVRESAVRLHNFLSLSLSPLGGLSKEKNALIEQERLKKRRAGTDECRIPRQAKRKTSPQNEIQIPESEWSDVCRVCNLGGKLYCCETCNQAFHLECIR